MIRKTFFGLAVVAFSAAGWRLVLACGPDPPRAIFSFRRHPDLPRNAFLNGKLGILRPSFERAYLVLAYRQLTPIGLDAREKEQARDYFKDRETGWWDHSDINWAKRYRETRERVPEPAILSDRTITAGQLIYRANSNSFELNCADDAYRNALRTLESRIKSFGVKSRAVREWTLAQDKVFNNCDSTPALFPDPADADLPAVIRADREYQIAAAHFYAESYDEARTRFARIGNDSSSPWQTLSRYLVARTLLRMCNHASNPPADARAALKREAAAILADPRLESIHGMTTNLLERLGAYDNDPEYFRHLATLLASRGQGNGLREELWNFGAVYDGAVQEAIAGKDNAAKADRGTDLALWMYLFQSTEPDSASRSIAQWKRSHSLPWLIAALSHASAAEAQRYRLLEAALAVPPQSPAYPTVAYHYYRLLLQKGDHEAVRTGIDLLLKDQSGPIPTSSVNLFRGLRMMAAPGLEDFLRLAIRQPVLVSTESIVWAGEAPVSFRGWGLSHVDPALPRLDGDSTYLLNRQMPLRVLRQAALNSEVPVHLRRQILLSAFMRAVILDEGATDVAQRLSETAPELKKFTNAYEAEVSAEGRRFAGVFLALHQPESRPFVVSGIGRLTRNGRIDDFRDNWWCPMSDITYEDRGDAVGNAFLTTSDIKEAESEYSSVSKSGSGSNYMILVVMAYAKAHPSDPRVPEALHLVVRAAHYGCGAAQSSMTTRAAFRFLHMHYPRSTWAARTPYWY